MSPKTPRPLEGLSAYQIQQDKIQKNLMGNQISTRRARIEQRRLLIQTGFFLVMTGVIAVGFLFFIVPNVIRLAGSFGGGGIGLNDDTVPPQRPFYSIPFTATSSAQITFDGYGEPESVMFVVLNGMQSAKTQADEDGNFSVQIDLVDGENVIAVYSQDAAQNESQLGREYRVIYDNTPPDLEWEQPQDQLTITNLRERQVEVRGTTEAGVKLYLNGRLLRVDSEGKFVDRFNLSDGENKLEMIATDLAGNETKQERIVTFRP